MRVGFVTLKRVIRLGLSEKTRTFASKLFNMNSTTSRSIVALLGLECPHVKPKSYRGLLGKSSRKVALGVLRLSRRLCDTNIKKINEEKDNKKGIFAARSRPVADDGLQTEDKSG